MKEDFNNHELPLGWQFAALSALWIVWISLVVWVYWKARENETFHRVFADPFMIFGPLIAGIPLLLFYLGRAVIQRAGSISAMPFFYRQLYCVFACLTMVAAVLSVVGGLLSLAILLVPPVRE